MIARKKKGFTIVELVIVIAVIAILAAVLIPTFATVIGNAEKSTALQACKSASTEYLSAQMQLHPEKSAQEILANRYFAYDDDDSGNIATGDNMYIYDGEKLRVPTIAEGGETVLDLIGWTRVVDGSNVYTKP